MQGGKLMPALSEQALDQAAARTGLAEKIQGADQAAFGADQVDLDAMVVADTSAGAVDPGVGGLHEAGGGRDLLGAAGQGGNAGMKGLEVGFERCGRVPLGVHGNEQ